MKFEECLEFQIDGLTDKRVSIEEYLDECLALAANLQERGVKIGTVVAVCSDNRLEYPVVALAVLMTGATLTGFGPGRSIREYSVTLSGETWSLITSGL